MAAFKTVGPAPHPGSTMELVMVAGVWVSWPECVSVGELISAVWRATHGVIHTGELFLSLTVL